MAFSDRIPEEQPRVKPFDPIVLDRTVIAIPLLKEMEDDLELIKKMEKNFPGVALNYNAVIEFNKKFRGGEEAARELVLKSLLKNPSCRLL